MAKDKEVKTNAMRMLEKHHIEYHVMYYECKEFIDGQMIADILNLEHERVYKTLVTRGSNQECFVFVIPIDCELDLKKAARSVGEKSLSMLPVKDIQKMTGYIRGGCTSIGMKKQYQTRIDKSAASFSKIIVSGGKIGIQLELDPEALLAVTQADWADITQKEKESSCE